MESDTQDLELLKQALESMIDAAHPAYVTDDFFRNKLIKARDAAFKALESNRLNAKERHRTTKNHIASMRKMVGEMYWINPDYPSSDNIIEAFEPITSSVEVNVGDRYEVSRAIRLRDVTVEVTELEENGDVKAYKIIGGDHIPDASKMIVPDGWQLVPKNPTEDMIESAHNSGDSYFDVQSTYKAMLSAAPKYTEGEQ